MKLKIVHQNQETRSGDEQMKMKEEAGEEELQMEDDNSPPIESSNPILLSGKRKRKPKELFDEDFLIIRRKKNKSSATSSKHGMLGSGGKLSSPVESKSPTLIRAEEVHSSLGNEQPSFLKVLVRSHVGSCFWMGLPVLFCKSHLPNEDTETILENENGEEFPIKYIAHKTGLSAGWRKFVFGNKLLEGDVLIFQLIEPCKFKVYIIRANDLNEVDGALSLLILDSQTKQSDAEGTNNSKSKKRRRLPLAIVQGMKHNEGLLSPQLGHPDEHSGNDSDEVASEVLEGSKFSESSSPFQDVNSFEEFHIVVNGVCIDSELPEHIRKNYYELCCSQNAFLHDHILPGLYCKLAAGMIFETVSIADAIRGCKLTTSRKEFEVWDKSLRSFKLLGLNVGFLRARLARLLGLAFESEDALDTRRYLGAKTELSSIEKEIRTLETKLVELKELSSKYENEIESLKTNAESYELNFQEEVNAPW
ncbi:hypothetical protein RD792_004135 [Penstemon davidsonii]|uniref:TF-B3 domain-containing protein n=1 Tax=Penstemon davidsonii TaxID=160366 RepID=A0ABR0DGK7_9LAMI|nr:hypothetical protein RD792_004135 [Penstemon davidsonii]